MSSASDWSEEQFSYDAAAGPVFVLCRSVAPVTATACPSDWMQSLIGLGKPIGGDG